MHAHLLESIRACDAATGQAIVRSMFEKVSAAFREETQSRARQPGRQPDNDPPLR
jgi:hypothetical protein